MNRLASVCFVVAFVFASLPAQAQGPGNNINQIAARVTALETALAVETTARQAAETTLQNNINTEVTNRAAAVTAEAGDRDAADTTLQNNINAEASSRAAGDTALDARVGKLEGDLVTADFVGGTYAIYLVGTSMDEGSPNRASSYVVMGTATLAADFTAHVTGTFLAKGMTEGANAGLLWTIGSGSFAIDIHPTWTYNDVTHTFSTGTVPGFNGQDFSVAAGGQVLVSSKGGAPSNNQQLTVWVRK